MPVLFMWIFLLRIFLRAAKQHRQHAVLRGCVNLHPVRQQIHKREVAVTAHGEVVSDGQTMPKTRTGTSASRAGHAGSFHVDFFTANLPPRGKTAPSARRSARMRESAPRKAADSQT